MQNDRLRTIYRFDMFTKEYIGEGVSEVTENGGIPVPADSTVVPPPSLSDIPSNMTPMWDIKGQEWQLVPDYRNVKVYNKETQECVSLRLGEVPDARTTTLEVPSDKQAVWDDEANMWLLPINILKERKIAEIKRDYLNADNGPCYTGVSGITTKDADVCKAANDIEEVEVVVEFNLVSRDRLQLLIDVPSVSKEGDKEAEDLVVIRDYNNRYVQVSKKQLSKILEAQKAAALANLHKKWELQERVTDAQTREEIEAIMWDAVSDSDSSVPDER